MKWKRRASQWAMLAAVLAGCAGGSEPVTTGSFVTDAAPLPTIDRNIWELAPAGCEDVLGADVEFGIADSAPELVVVLAGEGVVCVDTYSSLEADLVTIDPDRMDALWLGYVAALQEVEAFSDRGQRSHEHGNHERNPALDTEYDPREGQPQPQPSMESPVSLDEASVQPQPQPSDPAPPGGGTGSEGSSEGMNMHEAGMDCPPGEGPPAPAVPAV